MLDKNKKKFKPKRTVCRNELNRLSKVTMWNETSCKDYSKLQIPASLHFNRKILDILKAKQTLKLKTNQVCRLVTRQMKMKNSPWKIFLLEHSQVFTVNFVLVGFSIVQVLVVQSHLGYSRAHSQIR